MRASATIWLAIALRKSIKNLVCGNGQLECTVVT
jgi:hypothetical protein